MVDGEAGGVIPTGIVTFLFTDVEGSTRLWAEDRDAMSASLRVHDRILRDAVEAHHGYVFTTAGDSFAVAFGRASEAVAAAESAQAALADREWPGPRLRVRMGLHVGEAEERGGDYFGPAVNLAARLEAAGHGGQVLMTAPVCQAAGVAAQVLGLHALRDVAEPVQVFQLGEGEFPALRVVDAGLTNLPVPGTKLVGRTDDLVRVRTTLSEFRVVTLTAGGGTGKTRLALAVGEQELPHRADGVRFVDLTPVGDGSLVGSAVAAGLGLSLVGGDPFEQIVDYLADKELLLIVDNCEHLIDECAELAEMFVTRAGRCTLLATSRERLDIAGEQVVQLRPLSVDDDGAAAVELFAQRAAAVAPTFTLTKDNRSVVLELCRRLDGMPLAIELAASRITVLTPTELLAGLQDRFALLAGGRRRQRQRTLETTLDWSYNLCDPDEQRMLRALGAFLGSFDLDAVASVADVSHIAAVDLMDSLVARSLVVHDEVDGVSRYRLFETTAAYAAQRLANSGEATEVRDRHLGHYLELALGHHLAMWADLAAVERLGADRANITAAYEWAAASDDWGTAGRLLLGAFAIYHAHPTEGIELVDRCLDHLNPDDEVSMRLVCNQWWVHVLAGGFRRAYDAIRRLRHSPTPLHQLHGHCLLSIMVGTVDNTGGAVHLQRALEVLPTLPTGPDAVQAAALCETVASALALLRLEPETSVEHARSASHLHDQSGITSEFSVQASMSHAIGALMTGDPRAALEIVNRYGSIPSSLGIGDDVRALAYAALGDLEHAQIAARAHSRLAVTGQVVHQAGDSLMVLAALALAAGDVSTAADLLLNLGINRSPATVAYSRHLAHQLGISTEFAATQAARFSAISDDARSFNAAAIDTLRNEMSRLGWSSS